MVDPASPTHWSGRDAWLKRCRLTWQDALVQTRDEQESNEKPSTGVFQLRADAGSGSRQVLTSADLDLMRCTNSNTHTREYEGKMARTWQSGQGFEGEHMPSPLASAQAQHTQSKHTITSYFARPSNVQSAVLPSKSRPSVACWSKEKRLQTTE